MPIEIKNLSFTYGKKTPYEKKALDDISLFIGDGESVGIVGSTGSGKSTLIQHFNGLIKPMSGKITVDEIDLTVRKPDKQKLRKKIGMVFQYPEYQLFADTVLDDVRFGPLNFGMTKEEATENAKEAIGLVGLDFDSIKDRSPLEISGGQKRRVAIAGVIAYKPIYLVLDEPTAGLDPLGKREMLDLIASLKRSGAVKTVITVSHNMDEIAEYTDRVIALNSGKIKSDKKTSDFFYEEDVSALNLALPHAVAIYKMLEQRGVILPEKPLTRTSLTSLLSNYLGRNHD